MIVIGAGPAGEVLAGRLRSRSDKRVAIVERELVGGECAFYACMPSKALLRPAEALAEARRVPGAAEAAAGELDVAAVLRRRNEVIHELDDSRQLPWLRDRGVELIRGAARIAGERRVEVGGEVLLAADAVVVAVGSDPLFPPVPGLPEVHAWSNREITTAERVPERLIVLGGGPVGAEMAQAWAWLGSTVTLVEALDRLLPREEPFAGEQVADGLREAGVQLHVGTSASEVRRDGDEITLKLDSGASLSASHLLVAVGRRPRTDELGLESVGLEGGGYLEVDDHLQAPGLPWLYAIGDVNSRSLQTHAGKYQARVAADRILGDGGATARSDRDGPPRVTFTDPQVAAVGLTLEQAHERGIRATAVDLDTEATAGGSFYGRGAEGTTRFVVDEDREVLVGVTFVGPDVADLLQAATVATVAELPVRRLAHAIAPFPTRSELWLQFVEAYEARRGVTMHSGN